MRYEDGIPAGFDDIEHISRFMEPEDATDYFQQLQDELPWQEVTWNTERPLPRLVFRYGEFERQFREYNVLEELIAYVEAVTETDVLSVMCNLYRDGEDYIPYHRDRCDSHVMTLSLGTSRRFSIRKVETPSNQRDYSLANGDLFYFSPEVNKEYEHAVPKTKRVRFPHISIVFFTDEPYIHRKRHFRHINLLGFGLIPVWFEGPESQFPEDAVATMLPTQTEDASQELSFPRAGRPEFGSVIDAGALPQSFIQGTMQMTVSDGSDYSSDDE